MKSGKFDLICILKASKLGPQLRKHGISEVQLETRRQALR